MEVANVESEVKWSEVEFTETAISIAQQLFYTEKFSDRIGETI